MRQTAFLLNVIFLILTIGCKETVMPQSHLLFTQAQLKILKQLQQLAAHLILIRMGQVNQL